MGRALRDQIAVGGVAGVRHGIGAPALRSLERRECVARIAGVLDGVLAGSRRPHVHA
jgi:hypothetical protein